MKQYRRIAILLMLLLAGLFVESAALSVPLSVGGADQQASPQQVDPRDIPLAPKDAPYHKHPPKGPLPATIDPAQFKDKLKDKLQAYVAYSIAARIEEVLYQEPCFCPCNKTDGHKSLLDCYTSRHGEFCEACQFQAFFCFEEHKLGKSPKQIRKAMVQGKWGKWGSMDREQYARDYLATTAEQK